MAPSRRRKKPLAVTFCPRSAAWMRQLPSPSSAPVWLTAFAWKCGQWHGNVPWPKPFGPRLNSRRPEEIRIHSETNAIQENCKRINYEQGTAAGRHEKGGV